jgi:Flp pilus assembly protein TadD
MLFGLLKDLSNAVIYSAREWARRTLSINDRQASPVPPMSEEEAECRRTLESMPNLAEAHNRLGVVLKNAGRLAEAEEAFRRAITLQRDNVASHYNLGIVLAETRRPLEAEAAYRDALKLQPDFVEAHNNLGVILMVAGRLPEAEAAFRRALELAPHFVDARKNLGIVLARAGGFAEVEAEHGRSIRPGPEPVAASHDRGAAVARASDLWEAEAACRDVLRSKPHFAGAHNDLGVVLAQAGCLAEAEAAFRRAIELAPDFADAHNNLGGVLKDTGRLADADAAFRRALSLRADHEAARINRDFVRREITRLSEAETIRRRSVELHPASATSRYRLGLTLLELGKLDEAVASLKGVLSIEPRRAEVHRHLGLALMRKGQVDDAIPCFMEAIAIKPDFAKAMANLGAAYFLKEDPRQAAVWNEAALAIEPQQVEANRNMASILLERGDRDGAKRHLDRAHRKQSVDIEYATDPVRTVLVLWTRKTGNVPTIEFLFPTTINNRVNWVIESAEDDQADNLPEHDLVFNAMGDPDLIGDSLGPVSRFTESCERPLLNHPAKVARTARNHLPVLLDGLDAVFVPPVWRFADPADWEESIVDQLPLLIRPVDSHGGAGLELARTAAELARCRASRSGPAYVCRYVDFRSADSWFRKYRIIFVDREPYPCHLAISQNWMVHYQTADMESHPWKLEEEKAFLRDPEAVLGSANMEAIRSIGARMDLEYSGIDFSIMRDGRILVFEANPTMLVHPESIGGPVEHKNEYVFRIQERFEQMLKRFGG